jgi:hypothetical protein
MDPITSKPETPAEFVAARRHALTRTVGRSLKRPPSDGEPLSGDRRRYLLEEVCELYWNDLEWEKVTGEEEVDGAPLAELTFPGVMAFVRGLLLTEVPADSPVGPSPRPEVVDDFLEFLADQLFELKQQEKEADDPEATRQDYRMTAELLDQVLLTYHGVSPEDVGPEQPEGSDAGEG